MMQAIICVGARYLVVLIHTFRRREPPSRVLSIAVRRLATDMGPTVSIESGTRRGRSGGGKCGYVGRCN